MEIFIEWINDQVQNYLPKHQLFGLLAQFIAQSPGPLVHFRNFLEASKETKETFYLCKIKQENLSTNSVKLRKSVKNDFSNKSLGAEQKSPVCRFTSHFATI